MPNSAKAPTNELGRTGLKHFSGTIYEEFLPQLQGERGAKVYTEMSSNSPVVGAMLFAVESLLRSVDWSVEPASEAPKDADAAEFVAECMDDMSNTWEDFISEVLSMLVYGWSYFELVYKRRQGEKKSPSSAFDDGRVGWRKFAIRSQDTLFRWKIGRDGGIEGLWQYPVPSDPVSNPGEDTILIPIEKGLLFRTTSVKNNPEGRSMLRTAYRPWYISKRIEEIEAIGVERDLAGIPTAWIPIELLSSDRTTDQASTYEYFKDIVVKTKRDQQEGLILPLAYDENGNKVFDFELLSSSGKRSFDTGSIIQRYMQQMAMTVMADFILLGHENVGSFALSSDKTELFSVALGSWLDMIQETINRHAVRRLLELNTFSTDKGFPRILHGDIEKPDIQALGAYITALAGAGVPLFPDLVLENHLREAGDLPPVDEEEREKILEQQAQMQAQAQAGPLQMPNGKSNGGGPPAPMSNGQPPMSNGQPPKPVRKLTVQAPADDDDETSISKAVRLRPSYYDGSHWKTLRGRHRYMR